MTSLSGKVAVITGAGSGIGRELAIQAAAKGARLALVDISEGNLAETRRLVGSDIRVSLHALDVGSEQAMSLLPGQVIEQHGCVDILVNNAGIAMTGRFLEQKIEDVRRIWDINYWGTFYGCRFFLPLLLERPEAHIVNVSSLLGIVGLPRQSSYAATKFAVRAMSESLWVELDESPVRFSIVHPGGVKTGIMDGAIAYDEAQRQQMRQMLEKVALSPEKAAKKIIKGMEKNRMRILLCPETRFFDLCKRISPVGTHHLVRFIQRRFGDVI